MNEIFIRDTTLFIYRIDFYKLNKYYYEREESGLQSRCFATFFVRNRFVIQLCGPAT